MVTFELPVKISINKVLFFSLKNNIGNSIEMVLLSYSLTTLCHNPHKQKWVLTGVVQWVGHCPANRNITVSIPDQDTCLACWLGPWWGTCEQQLVDDSLTYQWAEFKIRQSPRWTRSTKKSVGQKWQCVGLSFLKQVGAIRNIPAD